MLLEKWKYPMYYFGADYSDHYFIYSRHRDSSRLELHNFNEIQTALGDSAIIARSNHFLVGWVEELLIKDTDADGYLIASILRNKLEDYPILNEISYWDELSNAAAELWQSTPTRDKIADLAEIGLSIFASRSPQLPEELYQIYEERVS